MIPVDSEQISATLSCLRETVEVEFQSLPGLPLEPTMSLMSQLLEMQYKIASFDAVNALLRSENDRLVAVLHEFRAFPVVNYVNYSFICIKLLIILVLFIVL